MPNNLDHPNWIAERAKCNSELLWDDLCTIVSCDTTRRKQEALKEGAVIRYLLHPQDTPQDPLYIKRADVQTGKVLGTCCFFTDTRTHEICVTMEQPDGRGTLIARWDAEASRCRLVVTRPSDGQEREFPHDELWKAVQYILEPFFFPKTSSPASLRADFI